MVPLTVRDEKEIRGLIPDNGKVENCQPGHNIIRVLRKCISKQNY